MSCKWCSSAQSMVFKGMFSTKILHFSWLYMIFVLLHNFQVWRLCCDEIFKKSNNSEPRTWGTLKNYLASLTLFIDYPESCHFKEGHDISGMHTAAQVIIYTIDKLCGNESQRRKYAARPKPISQRHVSQYAVWRWTLTHKVCSKAQTDFPNTYHNLLKNISSLTCRQGHCRTNPDDNSHPRLCLPVFPPIIN